MNKDKMPKRNLPVEGLFPLQLPGERLDKSMAYWLLL